MRKMHKLLDKLTMPLYELTHRQGQVRIDLVPYSFRR
jgi:hypothetical protein